MKLSVFANWGGWRVGVHRVELVGPGGAALPTRDALLSLELGAAATATATAAAQMSARDTLPRCVTLTFLLVRGWGWGVEHLHPRPRTHYSSVVLVYCLLSARFGQHPYVLWHSRPDSSFFIHNHSTSRMAFDKEQIILI